MSDEDHAIGRVRPGFLTPEQVHTYNTTGYLIVPELLDAEDIAPGIEAVCEQVDRVAAKLCRDNLITDLRKQSAFEIRLAELFSSLGEAEFLAYGESWREGIGGRIGEFHRLMTNVKILNLVESLVGSEIFSSPVYNVRPKVPGVSAGAVPWHQDKSYWPESPAEPVITVWVPFVDSTEENGCLRVLPGTHRRPVVSHHRETHTGANYTEMDSEHLERERRSPVTIPVKRGSVVVFGDRFFHMSLPNRSDHVRWSIDLRYQPADQDWMLEKGTGFMARSAMHPETVASVTDWLAGRATPEGVVLSE